MNKANTKARFVIFGLACTLSLAACEGGRLDASHNGLDSSTVNAAMRAEEGGGGISATVENSPYQYNGDKRYTAAVGDSRNLQVVSLASDASAWNILALTPRTGVYSCDDSGLQIVLQREGLSALRSSTGGSCEMSISAANFRNLRGHFHGQLVDDAGRVYALENGVFDIVLASAIPDLDQDGLADADDNCPFDANPEQADSNGNLIGDACDPANQEERS